MFSFGKSKTEKEFNKLMRIVKNSTDDDEIWGIATSIYILWQKFDEKCGTMADFLTSEEKQKFWLAFIESIIAISNEKIENNITPEEKGHYGSTLGAYLMLIYFEALANNEKRETTNKIFNVIEVYNNLGKEISEGVRRPTD